jgi:hypothetical protein
VSDLRECKKRALFSDVDECASCGRLDECIAAPRLTDDELLEAAYDRYLAPFFSPVFAAMGNRANGGSTP